MILIGALYYYLAPVRQIFLLLYISTLPSIIKKLKVVDIIFFIYLITMILFNFFRVGVTPAFYYVRLFFGCFFFYYYFRHKNINLEKIATVLSIITIVEFVAIKIYPSLTLILPNYLHGSIYLDFYAKGMGLLSGAYSFGGNRTVSGVLLLGIYSYLYEVKKKNKIILLIAILACSSTTAILLLFFYRLMKIRFKVKHIVISLLIITLFLIVFNKLGDSYGKFSLDYISYVLTEFKLLQIYEGIDLLNKNNMTFLFGNLNVFSVNSSVDNFGLFFGDFLMLDLLVTQGVLGFIFFITFYFIRINSINKWPLILIFLGTLHYQVIFALPGQILVGYFLSRNRNDKL